jgi:hypothetical protein
MTHLILLGLLMQQPQPAAICYATIFGPHQDPCTGEYYPLPQMRSPRIEWLEPESYTDAQIDNLDRRIIKLEALVEILKLYLANDPRLKSGAK